MPLDPSDPHDLRPTDEAAIETAHLALDGLSGEDSVRKAVDILKKTDGVTEVHGETAAGTITVTFDAAKRTSPRCTTPCSKAATTPRARRRIDPAAGVRKRVG